MFQKAKNIDTAFRQVRQFSLAFLLACALITSLIVVKCFQIARRADQRIFVLANGKILDAYAADRRDNLPVEARDHVKMFHFYFFTLDPDEKVIQQNVTRALYLADRSAKQQYDNLKENGYYANVISGNISQAIEADSIWIDVNQYPYYFRYQGQEKIIRPSSIVTRRLITEGYLRNVTRSDHNPHGFLLEKWRTIENTDLTTEAR